MAFVFPNHAANQSTSAPSAAHGTGMDFVNSQFIMDLPKNLLLAVLSIGVLWDMIMQYTTLWAWRLALARSSAQVLRLLSLRLHAATSTLATLALLVAYSIWFEPFTVAPFQFRVKDGPQGRQSCFLGGSFGLQQIALVTIVISLGVIIREMIVAFIFGFLPFSLGRIILWCISFFRFGNVNSHASTASILLIGYGVIFSLAVTFAYFSSGLEG